MKKTRRVRLTIDVVLEYAEPFDSVPQLSNEALLWGLVKGLRKCKEPPGEILAGGKFDLRLDYRATK